ncbi:23S rRNA (guanine745-N1)-methyltransferase [Actinopolymorpha cephalotaxi]|uniref:23S rRNA (Guanine745-N1)-methyltransferase n=1 Tax=Actinopolymorpha cephalotaxi TaxID=504797 RepID=A0A1I2NA13_9ACTN|nr:rRNA (guanine-N1)-methyltransferase [Actinopolymorpha cephalotaxi]NYH85611.1 23S rRNA (guanine745-N1)-methyltransferase [Actinopolymorpha cephalotaxi]SFG00765.1 23S rRNA (guanine745-N1)-methyltransferase [Actinopolymorpha cephalotaxi]
MCGSSLTRAPGVLRCAERHSFDVARQGYVNLLSARSRPPLADSGDMATARAEFLTAGHYAPLARRLAEHVADRLPAGDGLVVDAGAGTGYYLGAVLDRLPAATGLALDASVAGLRRAARAHERIGAVGWDIWQPWPLADGSASAVLNVFAPRNPAEFARVLHPGGVLAVVTPTAAHLAELRTLVAMLEVHEGKLDQLDSSLAGEFEPAVRETLTVELSLSPDDVRRVVAMGPNAHHLDRGDQRARLAELDQLAEPVSATASFVLSFFRRAGG